MSDDQVQRMLDQLMFEINELRIVAKRTETRMCALAHHLGASHVGAPPRRNETTNQRKETTV
jgi:urease accessory protein UreE